MSGVFWALVAAVAFAVTQIFNRKSNQLVDAYRTAFGMLASVELILIVRLAITGEFALLAGAPVSSYLYFVLATFIHYVCRLDSDRFEPAKDWGCQVTGAGGGVSAGGGRAGRTGTGRSPSPS